MPTPNEDGIDISHWNVVVDENQIPRYPLMSCKATEGKQFVSPKFRDFWAMFARLGAKYRGAYHWVRSDSTMKAQVDHLAKTLDSVGGLLAGDFVQLDWETTANVPNVTPIQIEEWCDLATARWGDRVIVYGAPWVPGFVDWRDRNPTFPVWLANYNVTLSSKGGWVNSAKYDAAVWQWSSTWKVPGFLWNPTNPDDGIDVNHIWSSATLDRLCLLEPTPIPEPPVPPTPSPGEDDMKAILYTVNEPDVGGAWFYVSPDLNVRTLATVPEYNDWKDAGALERTATPDDFRAQLLTFKPVGSLTDPARNVLGPAASADWKARATPSSGGGAVVFPTYTVAAHEIVPR